MIEEKIFDEKRKNKRTLAAIPGFNVGHTIGSVVLKAKRYVDEVLVIDDGSTDDTVKVAEYAGAKVLRHKKNMGYGAAIQSCFRYARENDFDVMVIIDGDAQHDADRIPAVMEPVIENGTDVSIGSRFVNGNGHDVPRYRRVGIGILTKLANAASKEKHRVSDGQSGFRAYSRNAILHINPKDDDMGVSAEILMQGSKKNLAYEEIPISCRYDVDGSTKNPVGHGLGVIISILKYMEVQHSLLFFGIPSVILFIAGSIFGMNTYFLYIQSGFLSFGPALITVALLILSMLLGMTGLILHAVINAQRRI
jgi:glycosyltransferase involved in cell wall biosynthesis